MSKQFVEFVQELYSTKEFIPLHEPRFIGNEKQYVLDTIDSTFVSSVGEYVNRIERDIAEYTGIKYAVATVNGTAALHASLVAANINFGDEVITQPLTFVATCNAIKYCGADPVFVDVSLETMGMCPVSLASFLDEHAEVRDGYCFNKTTGKYIKACVPMNTFGHSVDIDGIVTICRKYNIILVEDAAESLGSFHHSLHTGIKSDIAAFSFNGNKIITTGGGGIIATNNEIYAEKLKHITTTAKLKHPWVYDHDIVAFNYRMPNINAALGCAQLENLPLFVNKKRELALLYKSWFVDQGIEFFVEPKAARSNYWLNAVLLSDQDHRDEFLEYTNKHGVMTRPVWTPMHKLEVYTRCFRSDLPNTDCLENIVVNVPSSVIYD